MRINYKQKKFVFCMVLMLAAALGVCIYTMGIRSPLTRSVIITVPRGASVSATANKLAAAGAVDSAALLKFCVRMHGGRIQSGHYEFPRRTSAWRMAHMLATGDVAATTIVIPEGLTIRQIKNLLLSAGDLTGPVECGRPSDMPVCNLRDGDVFPDTYRVARGTTRLALLELSRKKMAGIQDAWNRAGHIAPYPLKSWADIVTLASIVQKETPRAEEMPIVASVYVNRLRKKMRLQADPTVVYALTDGLGDMQGAPLLRGHLQIDNPYNTYRNAGLPPAPIANVGQAALRAVMKPADTSYLYFVADGRGGHKFSTTYEEHQRNHADWRRIKKAKN